MAASGFRMDSLKTLWLDGAADFARLVLGAVHVDVEVPGLIGRVLLVGQLGAGRHRPLVVAALVQLQDDFESELLFIPNRGDFPRGIFATLYTTSDETLEQTVAKYEDFYKNEPFVTVTTTNINMKQVVQTNKCIISLLKKGNRILITSIIDNLTKGASGQAIQNMNLMFGLEETTGLHLKPSGF